MCSFLKDNMHRARATLVACAFLPIVMNLAVPTIHAADPNEFDVWSFDQNLDGTPELPGRLLVPENYDPNQSYPIVVFFHGQGESGDNNTSQINQHIDPLIANAKSREFFLYAPQLLRKSNGNPPSSWSVSKVDSAMIMVANAAQEYNIDASRVYVTGLSLGGGATWSAISRYSGSLAGAIPLSAIPGKFMDYNQLVGVPVWAYHAEMDRKVHPDNTRNQVNAIRAAEGKTALSFPLNVDPSDPYYSDGSPFYTDGTTFYDDNSLRYTEYLTGAHGTGVWQRAYGEAPLYDWMLGFSIAETSALVGEKILFDLGNHNITTVDNFDTPVDSSGNVWNDTFKDLYRAEGVALPFCNTSGGNGTAISLAVTEIFPSHTTGGSSIGTPYDDRISTDGWITERDATETVDFGELTISGLVDGGVYSLDIFATHSNDDGGRGRMSRYKIGTEEYDIQVYNNVASTAFFAGVTADSNGEIALKVYPTPGLTSRYGQVNTIELSVVSLPSDLAPGYFEVTSFDHRNNGTIDLPGQLYIPEGYDADLSWPMVVFFHGEGERGADNLLQINSNIDELITKADSEGFLVYAPQLSASIGSWNSGEVDKAVRMASNITRDYNVDFSRIYVSGLSMGGGGVWNAFSRYAQGFAAALPIAGYSSGNAIYSDMANLPIWAFHSRDDTVVQVSSSRTSVNDIRVAAGKTPWTFLSSGATALYEEAGDPLRYTEFDSTAHDIWTNIYSDSATYTWLLAQSATEQDLLLGELMLFDFGNKVFSGSDSQGHYWNSTDKHYYETYGTSLAFTGTTTGRHTAVSIYVEELLDGHMTNGVVVGTPYDQDISTDGWLTVGDATSTTDFGQIAICGLVPGGVYKVEIFATNPSDDGGRGRMSRYEIDSQVQDLEAYNNTSNTAVFANCTADIYGEIRIKTYPTPGMTSRYGQINALELSVVSLP